jgi:hypothetical protein
MADGLAKRGYIVEIVHYFDRTSTLAADPAQLTVHLRDWTSTIRDAITDVARRATRGFHPHRHLWRRAGRDSRSRRGCGRQESACRSRVRGRAADLGGTNGPADARRVHRARRRQRIRGKVRRSLTAFADCAAPIIFRTRDTGFPSVRATGPSPGTARSIWRTRSSANSRR